jgi:hypothetical protein
MAAIRCFAEPRWFSMHEMRITNGYLPQFDTYIGPETPNPLFISILRSTGDAPPIYNVLQDIIGLTKINYNTCNFNDSLPVTVRFAEKVGDVLAIGSAKGAEKATIQVLRLAG